MEKGKKIGIDARFYGKAGPGRYTKNIIKHLEKVDKKNKYFVLLCLSSKKITIKQKTVYKVCKVHKVYKVDLRFQIYD